MRKQSFTHRRRPTKKTAHAAKDATPRCRFGNPTDASGKMPGYDGDHHCPLCAAEVLRLIGEVAEPSVAPASVDPIPVAEAFALAADALGSTNGAGTESTQQPALFDLAKPFNLEGAFHAIAEKNQAVKWAHEAYEASKEHTSDLRKTWEREAKQLQDLIDQLAERQKTLHGRATDRDADAREGARSGEGIGTATTSRDAVIVQPAPASAAGEAVSEASDDHHVTDDTARRRAWSRVAAI